MIYIFGYQLMICHISGYDIYAISDDDIPTRQNIPILTLTAPHNKYIIQYHTSSSYVRENAHE